VLLSAASAMAADVVVMGQRPVRLKGKTVVITGGTRDFATTRLASPTPHILLISHASPR
jgi:hypothetical protein